MGEGGKGKWTQKELTCVTYTYRLPTRKVNITYCKHVLGKIKIEKDNPIRSLSAGVYSWSPCTVSPSTVTFSSVLSHDSNFSEGLGTPREWELLHVLKGDAN